MSEQDRYRGGPAQRGRASENQWQRDYGQRDQRLDPRGRAVPPRPQDNSRNDSIERELRDNDFPRDDGYARDDRFLLDFGPADDREFRPQERGYRGPSSADRGRYFQPDPRQHRETFGSRSRAEADRPSGLQVAGFYGRGPKGYIRSDARIREDVCERLSDSDEVDASDIEVTVLDREVTLEGSVETRRMKHLAEDIADAVPGVEDVHNRVTVRKALLKDVADRLLGHETPEHHAHGGTKTTAATNSAETGASPTSANGHA
ncbi:MAG: BON domain-containing protein [Pseudomonadota bacterium]